MFNRVLNMPLELQHDLLTATLQRNMTFDAKFLYFVYSEYIKNNTI